MFHGIQIRNFFTCEDVTLDRLGPLTALVGRNGVGKTSIMRVIEMVARVVTTPSTNFAATAFSDFVNPPFRPSKSIEVEFTAANIRLKLVLGWRLIRANDVSERTPVRMSISETLFQKKFDDTWAAMFTRRDDEIRIPGRQEGIKVGPTSGAMHSLLSLLPQGDALLPVLTATAEFFRSIHYYPLDEPNIMSEQEATPFIRASAYQQWVNERGKGGAISPSVTMRLLHVSQTEPAKLDELKHLVGEDGLGLLKDIDIQAFNVPAAATTSVASDADMFYFVRFILPGGQAAPRTYSQLSYGTRRILRLLTSILVDDSAVALLEQPEDGIHLGLLYKVMSLLKTYTDPGQIILSTHSTAVFNGLQPEEVRLVFLKDGATQVRALTVEEMGAAFDYIAADGEFSEYLRALEE